MQAPQKTARRQQATESLRLALSMRGGVSLAVWIGGAVAEIDTLRKASAAATGPNIPNPNAKPPVSRRTVYADLLELASYSGVEVDILTGASAGGLNGAIYAASLVYGFDFDQMADVWLELADIEALSRPVVWNKSEQAPSLLDGDGYFLEKCRRKLEEFVEQERAQGPITAQVTRLDLLLSATRRVPERQVLRNDSFNEINESRSSAFFHFHHLGGLDSPLSDFGADPDGNGYAHSVTRLAHAGRASSSFPVAFEPATIKSTASEPPSAENLFGIFSESGDAVEVLDGGVLDNIPVAKAIEAIAAAPAEAPTSRWLLYLHPSPADVDDVDDPDDAGPSGDAPQSSSQSRLVGIIADLKATLSLKFNNESLVDDMVDLDRHNARVVERRATRITLLQTSRRQQLSNDAAYAAWAAADAQHVRDILADPTLTTATHPFVKRAYGDLSADWTPVKRSALFTLLQSTLTDHYESMSAYSGAGPEGNRLPLIALSDTIEVLLAVAQQVLVENRDAQRILYRIRLLVEVLNSIWEQSWLEAVQTAPDDGSSNVVEWIRATSRDCMKRSEIVTDEILRTLPITAIGVPDPLHDALHSLYNERVGVPFTPEATMPSLEPVWALVNEQAHAIIDEALQAGDFEDPVVDVLERALRKPELGLSWFSQACAPLHRRRLAGESEIRFLRVAGSNESPLARYFSESGDSLSVQDKLAGNQVANFGAFFSAQFRANDWMWGRLDAAQSLVDLLADSMRWFNSEDISVQEVLDALEAIVTSPFGHQDGWHEWARAEWLEHKDEVERELAAAKPSASDRVSHPLEVTKQLLVSRLQAEILCSHITWVARTGETIDDGPEVEEPPDADSCLALAAELTAGTDRVPASLDTKRWARIGMRLGLNAWNALTPGGTRQWIVALLKPMYLSLVALLVLPRRAMLAGALGIGALAVGRWEPDTPLFSADPNGWFVSGAGSEFLSWPRVIAAAIAVTAGLLAVFMQIKGTLRKDTPRRTFVAAGGALAVVLIGAGLVVLEASVVYGAVILGAALAAGLVVALLCRGSAKPVGTGDSAGMAWVVVLLGGFIAGGVLAMMVTRASLLPAIVPIAAVFVVFVGMNWMHWPHRTAIAAIAVVAYIGWWQVLQQGWWAIASFTTAVFLATLYVSKIDVFGTGSSSAARMTDPVIDARVIDARAPAARTGGASTVAD